MMSGMRRAVIVAIGDELLSGETVDTNSSYLDGLLEARGFKVVRHFTVADEIDDIASVFKDASQLADIVLSTGGLGPTQDDLTMAALAQALGCPLSLHQPTLTRIEALFASFGREMTPNNRQQAMVPELGEVLVNEVGTAPGFTATLHTAQFYLMPGVPREVRWLMKHRVLPRLASDAQPRLRRTIKVVGLGESRLEQKISEVVRAHPEVRFGYRTLGMENHVKLMAEGAEAEARVAQAEAAVRGLLGEAIYGADEDVLEAVVGDALSAVGQTVGCAESCTGGLVSKRLTDVSGSSRYMVGGIVAYANSVKTQLLGVPEDLLQTHGAVSEPVVRQMAEGVRSALGVDWGVATTGIAGPSGGTEDKPVGCVWMAVAGAGRTESMKLQFPGDREQVRRLTAVCVLNMLRQCVQGLP